MYGILSQKSNTEHVCQYTGIENIFFNEQIENTLNLYYRTTLNKDLINVLNLPLTITSHSSV